MLYFSLKLQNLMSFQSSHLFRYLPKFNNAEHLYVAYSGGLDSHVLLHAMVSLVGLKSFTAIHINHQLSINADNWQQHCKDCCSKLGVPLIVETIKVENNGFGLEQAAREIRYGIFRKLLDKTDLLLFAHHADDQAETVLYRLLRGAGTKGLSGMPISRPLGLWGLLRPLLTFSRADLASYASIHGLEWIEDESYRDVSFDRNFLRHKVLPIISERWPDCSSKLNHTANLCADSDHLAEVLAIQDFAGISEKSERIGWSIPIDNLACLEESRQANVLRYWVSIHKLPSPRYSVIRTVLNEMLLARPDAKPLIVWVGVQLRRFKKRLYLLPADSSDSNHHVIDTGELAVTMQPGIKWDGINQIMLPNKGNISTKLLSTGGLRISKQCDIEIRFRVGSERCKPFGRNGSSTLKKLLQEYALEPWLRSKVPLIYIDGKLAAVGDLWVCDGFFASPNEFGVELQWRFF